VHTAGVNPLCESPELVFKVNLLGTANIIDAFQAHLGPGSTMVCVASRAGHSILHTLPAELQRHFATAPTLSLLDHPEFPQVDTSMNAYRVAKVANILRVQVAASSFGKLGARINTVSPGVIYIAMGKGELDGLRSQLVKDLIEKSPLKRYGHADEVATAVAFLAGPGSSFITGSDLLVDGIYSSRLINTVLQIKAANTSVRVESILQRNG
jgi:NAD(P)-dependent dehydrogenase (short-subunit alcohol dehydrogenase family)